MKLHNINILITGASKGFGKKIVDKCLMEGANLLLCSRSFEQLENEKKRWDSKLYVDQKLNILQADVSSEKDINLIHQEMLSKFETCDVIINNAGVYGPLGKVEEIDWEEWINSIKINLFGSIMVAKSFINHFKKRKSGKIIQMSGGGATNPMPFITSYAVSKAGIVRFMESLSLELEDYNVDVNCVAPGALNTQMLDQVLQAGPSKVGEAFFKKSLEQKQNGGSDISKALDLIVFLASNDSNGITGKLISAQWDNWINWKENKEELNKKDIYTLRRIVGKDRNCDWGDV